VSWLSSSCTVTASQPFWNSAKIWYVINKNPNSTNADNKIFTKTLLAFLKLEPSHQSVIYKYPATSTIIKTITQYIHANTLATLIIRFDVFSINVELSAAR
jgi:hypothetical protein